MPDLLGADLHADKGSSDVRYHPAVRRFTLITIIVLLVALLVAGAFQLLLFLRDDRAPVPAPSPAPTMR